MHVETLISFDPGGTTGYAIKREDSYLDWGQLGPGKHHLDLWCLLEKHKPDIIVFEQFVYQRRELSSGVSLNLDAKEYIGVLNVWGSINNVRTVGQSVGHVKAFCTDAKLAALELDLQHKDRHAKDAIRHLLYYQVHIQHDRQLLEKMKGRI